MATILLQVNAQKPNGAPKGGGVVVSSETVSASPGRLHYATVGRRLRCFERVGVDRSTGNEIYRDQMRYR